MEGAVVYCRQSFSESSETPSLAVQEANCRRWCREHNIEVIGVYKDADTSSELYPDTDDGRRACALDRGFQRWKRQQRTKGRKEYKVALGQAFLVVETKRPKYIVVNTANRLGRPADNSSMMNFIYSFLIEHGCSIVDASSNDVLDFGNRMMMVFRMMRDALEYAGLEEKRRSAIESIERRKNEYRAWSNAFGVVMMDGEVHFDTAKSDVVKYVYEAFLQGHSYNSILNHLNADHHDLAIGRQWYATNVKHILSNPIYAGYMENVAGDIGRAVNCPTPLVPFSTWTEVQRLMESRKDGRIAYNAGGGGKHWLPFSHLLKCSCGRRMQMKIDNGIVYRCVNDGDHICNIRVDDEFLKSMQGLLVMHVIQSRREIEAMRSIDAEIDSLTAEVAKAERKLQTLYDAIQDDEDLKMLKGRIGDGKANVRELKTRLAEAEAKRTLDVNALETAIEEDWSAISEDRLGHDDYERLLRLAIKAITVHRDHICILLADGNLFDLPRIRKDGRGRMTVPPCRVYATTTDESLAGIIHYIVVFGEGEIETSLVETDRYQITLKHDAGVSCE